MYFKQKNSLKNRSDLPDNSITSNVYFAMNNRYSISNDMSERPISLLKEKFSVSESHEIKYDSKNAYCLLMNEIETDNLYQDDELNNKFYGVLSDTADDEFFGIYIFDGENKKIFGCVIASVSGKNITAKLGILTLSKAISQHPWVLKNGSKVLLFVREFKNDIYGNTAPYTYLGTANYVSHNGSRPMNIMWKLDEPIPAKYLKKTNKLVVG